jgi:hypothetical protein
VKLKHIPVLGSLCKNIDQKGQIFFQSGKRITGFLDCFARALRRQQFDKLDHFYSDTFFGNRLGINEFSSGADREGIRVSAVKPQSERVSRGSAQDEWRTYIEGFEAIEEISLHLYRLHEWKKRDYSGATVRFELIGRRQDEGKRPVLTVSTGL